MLFSTWFHIKYFSAVHSFELFSLKCGYAIYDNVCVKKINISSSHFISTCFLMLDKQKCIVVSIFHVIIFLKDWLNCSKHINHTLYNILMKSYEISRFTVFKMAPHMLMEYLGFLNMIVDDTSNVEERVLLYPCKKWMLKDNKKYIWHIKVTLKTWFSRLGALSLQICYDERNTGTYHTWMKYLIKIKCSFNLLLLRKIDGIT